MTNSANYLGGGGARIERPHDYYEVINNRASKNRAAGGVSAVSGVNSSQKVNSGQAIQNPSSKFDRILQKNQSAKNQHNKDLSNNNLQDNNSFSKIVDQKKNLSPMDIKQSQYDSARQNFSQKVMQEIVKKSDHKAANTKFQAGRLNDLSEKEDDGTDIALEELAIKYEEQIHGIMWNLIYSAGERDYPGGLGEELFHKELVSEMQKYTNTGKMGPIAKSIYQDMVRTKKENSKAL